MHPLETRYRAVVHYLHFDKSLRRVSKFYNVSKSSLQRWVKQKFDRKQRTKFQLKREIIACIENTFRHNPFATLGEVAHEISKECNLKRSSRTVGRYMKMVGYSRKVATRRVDYKHDPNKIFDFCNKFNSAHKDGNLIAIDEAGFYVGDHPKRGWSRRGERLSIKCGRTLRRSKYTLLMAVNAKGVVGYKILDHNCKKADFVSFVAELNAPRGSTLMMDNIQFHHSVETKQVAQANGYQMLYTPPYSPRMNPIEYVFGVIKPEYRKKCPCVSNAVFNYKDLMNSVIDSRMACDFSKYFEHVCQISLHTLEQLRHMKDFCFEGYD